MIPHPTQPVPRQSVADAVAAWARDAAAPIDLDAVGNGSTAEALTRSLAGIVGEARVVALGEATHGSRESFRWRRLALRSLIHDLGFDAVALEASFSDCLDLDAFVRRGEGDPEQALHAQGFWTLDTVEMLELVLWLRGSNASSGREVGVFGFDLQVDERTRVEARAGGPLAGRHAVVARQAARYRDIKAAFLRLMASVGKLARSTRTIAAAANGASDPAAEALLAWIDEAPDTLLERSFDLAPARRDAWIAWAARAEAAHAGTELAAPATVVRSWLEDSATLYEAALDWPYRDACMAENARWILEHLGAGARIVLLGHNGHLARRGPQRGERWMGERLADDLGDEYVAIGFELGTGSFRAMPIEAEHFELHSFELDAPAPGSVGDALQRARDGAFLLDLRSAPHEGPVRRWLDAPQRMRSIGSQYSASWGEERSYAAMAPAISWDALVFVPTTTASRPNPLTRARFERGRFDLPRPAPCPEEWRGLVGEYGEGAHAWRVFEREGRLFARLDRPFEYPLEHVEANQFRIADRGPEAATESIRFSRDEDGRALRATIGDVVRERSSPVAGAGFRIEPRHPIETLRQMAEAATPPAEADRREPDLVDLRTFPGLDGLAFDLRYATENNFMGTPFYERPEAWAQRAAAEALARVQRQLGSHSYGLTVYDAFRPWRVTKMFWDATPESLRAFVAEPARGSRHNRGCALDVTLHELRSGRVVDMPSGYDEFSPRADPNYRGGTALQRWNRALLRNAMEAEGFRVYANEWWHFDLEGWQQYPILEDFP